MIWEWFKKLFSKQSPINPVEALAFQHDGEIKYIFKIYEPYPGHYHEVLSNFIIRDIDTNERLRSLFLIDYSNVVNYVEELNNDPERKPGTFSSYIMRNQVNDEPSVDGTL